MCVSSCCFQLKDFLESFKIPSCFLKIIGTRPRGGVPLTQFIDSHNVMRNSVGCYCRPHWTSLVHFNIYFTQSEVQNLSAVRLLQNYCWLHFVKRNDNRTAFAKSDQQMITQGLLLAPQYPYVCLGRKLSPNTFKILLCISPAGVISDDDEKS